jgi:hypothetical protein
LIVIGYWGSIGPADDRGESDFWGSEVGDFGTDQADKGAWF